MVQFIIIITILKKRSKNDAPVQESEIRVCTVEEAVSIAEEDAGQKKQITEAQAHQSAAVEITEELLAQEPQEILPDAVQEETASAEGIADSAVPQDEYETENSDNSVSPEPLPEPESEPEPQKPLSPFENVKILVCEDHEQNREVMGGMLQEFGIEPEFAANGMECMDILNSGKMFDMIFMDLQMPVMDGYEAARSIRSNSKFDSIPIISMPSNMMREIVNKCFETGMNDRIAKPVEFDRLEYVLAKWLPQDKKILI